jgi:hypothetical protein
MMGSYCGSLAARSVKDKVYSAAGRGEKEGTREETKAICNSTRCLFQSGMSAVMSAEIIY